MNHAIQTGGAMRFSIRIGELPLTLCFHGCDLRSFDRLAEQYAAFAVPDRTGYLTIQVNVETGPPFIPIESARTWQIRSGMTNNGLQFESHFEAGRVEWTAGRGTLLMRPQGSPENFLRVICAWRCLEQGSLLLHASGVIRQGVAHVFLGPSGAGKTTIARLSTDDTILSDDMVHIGKQHGRFHAYGVPFRGELPEAPRTNAVAELGGLFALVKGPEHRITGLGGPEAVARIVSCVPFVMADAVSARRAVDIAAELCAAVPLRSLHFRQDNGFWGLIDGSA